VSPCLFVLEKPQRHLNVFHPASPPILEEPSRLRSSRIGTSLKLSHPPASLDRSALFSLLSKRLEGLASPSRSPALRVWLPSLRRKPLQSYGTVTFRTLLGFSLQSFSPPPWSVHRSPVNDPLSRFHTKSSRTSYRRLSGRPTEEAVLLLPNGLDRGGAFCSPGFSDLLGFPLLSTRFQASLSEPRPLALEVETPYSMSTPEPQGREAEESWNSLANEWQQFRPIWPFPPTVVRNPFE
jgi:hypothetical protein